jgi:hypothetical protein
MTPTALTGEQFVQALQSWGAVPPMYQCVDLPPQPGDHGPRICPSGLLPYGGDNGTPEIDVLVWDDGLCLVSKRVWGALGGD